VRCSRTETGINLGCLQRPQWCGRVVGTSIEGRDDGSQYPTSWHQSLKGCCDKNNPLGMEREVRRFFRKAEMQSKMFKEADSMSAFRQD
jgi:hypothetical protein